MNNVFVKREQIHLEEKGQLKQTYEQIERQKTENLEREVERLQTELRRMEIKMKLVQHQYAQNKQKPDMEQQQEVASGIASEVIPVESKKYDDSVREYEKLKEEYMKLQTEFNEWIELVEETEQTGNNG